MRSCIITAVFALTLVACSSKMQQLESAGEKLNQCVNQCSFSVAPVSDGKSKQSGTAVSSKDADANQSQAGAGDRIQTVWNSRLNLW